ncbi:MULTISPECIES: hypothetical protein [Bacteroides]|jgi:hypothetical protein|uniref:hypothetical protein n=1 Tax=Bacteroides TaxID=816 RepID=UPI00090802C4|nr:MULTISPECIES: hypothetical protein [Bacteroides]
MANKKERPAIENPLANMGLDEIVRGITANEAQQEKPMAKTKEPKKRTSAGMKRFEENLDKYTGVSEQGVAIWLPKEVKKRLEVIRANADRNIPLRSLAAAIIMTYIEENENLIDNL